MVLMHPGNNKRRLIAPAPGYPVNIRSIFS